MNHFAYKRYKGAKMLTTKGVLTYCANGRTTVLMYADAVRLLVFGAFLTSVRQSENGHLFYKFVKFC